MYPLRTAYIEVMTMTHKAPRICRSVVLSAFLLPTSLLAQGMTQGISASGLPSPDSSMTGRTGSIHSLKYPQLHEQGMSGISGRLPVRQMQAVPSIPYVTNPYGGMFGSMGNIYSPYYRQFHQDGMSGPLTGVTDIPGIHYNVNPYVGMYGSMGNVYSPYYRQFHQSGRSGTTGALNPGVVPGQGMRHHYPYFLPPTMGNR